MSREVEDHLVWGFFVETDQKFYYLENGLSRVHASLERLRSLLLHRGIITMIGRPQHKLITYAEAESKGYVIEPVFTSQHVRDEYMKTKEKQTGQKTWL